MNLYSKYTIVATIAKQGAGEGLLQPRYSPNIIRPTTRAEKPNERLPQTSVAAQQGDVAHPQEPQTPTHTQGSHLSWSPSPEVDVKQFYHDPEDNQQDRVAQSQRRRIYEEHGDSHVPPLLAYDPDMQILGRSRLWGLWTDSVRLQRRIEFLRDVAKHSMIETRADRFF